MCEETKINCHDISERLKRFSEDIDTTVSVEYVKKQIQQFAKDLETYQKQEHFKRHRIKVRDQVLYLCMKNFGVKDNFKQTVEGKLVLKSLADLEKQYTAEQQAEAYKQYKTMCGVN